MAAAAAAIQLHTGGDGTALYFNQSFRPHTLSGAGEGTAAGGHRTSADPGVQELTISDRKG